MMLLNWVTPLTCSKQHAGRPISFEVQATSVGVGKLLTDAATVAVAVMPQTPR